MKILIAGNSQASCLKSAFDAHSHLTRDHEVHFHVFPGGYGPYFDVVDGRLKVQPWGVIPNFPPRAFPEAASTATVDSYDCIAVSALGYVDGGFLYKHSALTSGQVHRFKPRTNGLVDRLISASCARSIVESVLGNQAGFKFLGRLRRAYAGPIVVQPFPQISSAIAEHPDWVHNQLYEDPIGAHRFFSEVRSAYLERTCAELSCAMLPYPAVTLAVDLFTPAALMRPADGLHPLLPYGAAVLQQIVEAAEAATRS